MKEVFLVLNDIRSVHNVGSIFRTADCAGLKKIYLCGTTPTPLDRFNRKRSDVAKVALGAEESVKWEYFENVSEVIDILKEDGVEIIAVEQDDRSEDYKSIAIGEKVALVFGNEVGGLNKSVLDSCDRVAEIPLKGKKESLNVSVSVGIALFRILNI